MFWAVSVTCPDTDVRVTHAQIPNHGLAVVTGKSELLGATIPRSRNVRMG